MKKQYHVIDWVCDNGVKVRVKIDLKSGSVFVRHEDRLENEVHIFPWHDGSVTVSRLFTTLEKESQIVSRL